MCLVITGQLVGFLGANRPGSVFHDEILQLSREVAR